MKLQSLLLVLLAGMMSTVPLTVRAAEGPTDAVVEVDGVKLTRDEANAQVEQILERMKDTAPPDQIEQIRQQMMNRIVEHFIVTTILMNEAERRNISVGKEEEDEALAKMKGNLPPDMSWEEFMKDNFVDEEKIRQNLATRLRTAKLMNAAVPDDFDISEEEISEFEEEHGDDIGTPENVYGRRILIAVAPGDDEETKTEKKKKAGQIRQQLVDGADFDDMAAKHSDWPSKNKRNYGLIMRGRGSKAFDDVVFSQEKGAIGPVVETDDGYHIIQVTLQRKAETPSQEQVVAMAKETKRQRAIEAFLAELRKNAQIERAARD